MSEDFEDAKPVRRGPLFEDAGPVQRGYPVTFRDWLKRESFDRYGDFIEAEDWEELVLMNIQNESLPASHRDEDMSAWKEINYDGF